MASEFDIVSEQTTPKPGMALALMKRAIVIDSASRDPQATATTGVIPRGTPMAPVSGGKFKPIRRTTATDTCAVSANTVKVSETTMFAAGDVLQVVTASNPAGTAQPLGTIATINAGVSVVLAANAATAVATGDIIEVAENSMKLGAVILESDVDLRDPEGNLVDKAASGVFCGQMFEASLNYNDAGGITYTRLRAELPRVEFIPATDGATALSTGGRNSVVASPTLTLMDIANEDTVWKFVPGFAGTVESSQFCVGVEPASTPAKDIDLSVYIDDQVVTGGVMTLLTDDIDEKGAVVAGTAITAKNAFGPTSTISVKCSEATAAFAEGSGCVILELAPA